jgi:hypothetical protein
LIAAVLTIAIGVPIVSFVGDINMAQPTTSAGERAAFFGLAFLERADEWFNSPPVQHLAWVIL